VANEPWTQLDFRRTEKVEFNWVRLRKAKREILQHTEKHDLVTKGLSQQRRGLLTCQGNVGLYLLRDLSVYSLTI
jgi:hypothetical protein